MKVVNMIIMSGMLLNSPAIAEEMQWNGPGRAALKAFVSKAEGMTDLPWPVAFYGDFTGDAQDDAVVFVYTNSGGSSSNLDVALFTGDGTSFRFKRYARNVFGSQPRNVKFAKGRVEITTTMPKAGDPHCCPTGSKRFLIRTD